jgi:hypothetical protein
MELVGLFAVAVLLFITLCLEGWHAWFSVQGGRYEHK